MSNTIEITNTRMVLKRNFTVHDLINNDPEIKFGARDDYLRLRINETAEYTVLFTDPNIGRGVEVAFPGGCNIELHLNSPCSISDVNLTIKLLRRALKLCKAVRFKFDGVIYPTSKLDKLRQMLLDEKQGALEMFQALAEHDKNFSPKIAGALNPIVIDKNNLNKFDNNLEKFSKFLDDIQQRDVHYPREFVIQKQSGIRPIYGGYVVSPDIATALPLKPSMPHKKVSVAVDQWIVAFSNASPNGMPRMVNYADFIASVDTSDRYDAERFVVKLSSLQIRKILRDHEIKI